MILESGQLTRAGRSETLGRNFGLQLRKPALVAKVRIRKPYRRKVAELLVADRNCKSSETRNRKPTKAVK